jgi:hypothetical protein
MGRGARALPKRILVALLALIVACTAYVLAVRHGIENDNRTISFLMDGPDIVEHSTALGVLPGEYLSALRDAGLFGVVVPYGDLELRQLVKQSELELILVFDGEPIAGNPSVYNLEGVAGVAFGGFQTSALFLDHLDLTPDEQLLYLIGRNDTFRGYLPSAAHMDLIAERYPAVRTYRISRAETNSAHTYPESMAQRWLLNIREYNTRAIYARPFFDGGVERNVQYVEVVVQTLTDSGYDVGLAKPFPPFYPGAMLTALLVIGVGSLAVLLAAFLGLPELLLLLGLAGVGALSLLSFFGPLRLYVRLATALAGAIAASSLGVVWAQGKKTRKAKWWLTFLVVNIMTLLGALMTAALLSDTDFFIEYSFFRGVKLQYVVPLFVIGMYLAVKVIGWSGFREVLNWPRWVKVTLPTAVAVALALYVWRSGNITGVSAFELFLRDRLDNLLIVRPRFKELIAHPVLLLSLYWRKRLPRAVYALGIGVATIGQVSIVNTFLHIRTPLALSLLRTFHGLWIGTIIGLLAIAITTKIIEHQRP